ncbi:MAG: Bax inhibitor-1 family protein [Candidatus Neomarinimicrobiota bacterium]
MFFETSLLFKTMVILSAQIGIVFGLAYFIIKQAQVAYKNGTKLFGYSFRGAMNMNRELDLVPYHESPKNYPATMSKVVEEHFDNETKKMIPEHTLTQKVNSREEALEMIRDGYDYETKDRLFPVLIIWFVGLWVTLFLATSGVSLPIGLTIFTIQSIAFGILLGFIMLQMDENDGLKALKIVLFVTLITGYIGYSDFYSFSENIGLKFFLFFSLLGLIILSLIRTVIGFSRKATRYQAIFGAIIFSIFLLVDFNMIKRREGTLGMNNWETAFEFAFTLYLDMINLLLEILEAMSNN